MEGAGQSVWVATHRVVGRLTSVAMCAGQPQGEPLRCRVRTAPSTRWSALPGLADAAGPRRRRGRGAPGRPPPWSPTTTPGRGRCSPAGRRGGTTPPTARRSGPRPGDLRRRPRCRASPTYDDRSPSGWSMLTTSRPATDPANATVPGPMAVIGEPRVVPYSMPRLPGSHGSGGGRNGSITGADVGGRYRSAGRGAGPAEFDRPCVARRGSSRPAGGPDRMPPPR